jgi:hypothetical protein
MRAGPEAQLVGEIFGIPSDLQSGSEKAQENLSWQPRARPVLAMAWLRSLARGVRARAQAAGSPAAAAAVSRRLRRLALPDPVSSNVKNSKVSAPVLGSIVPHLRRTQARRTFAPTQTRTLTLSLSPPDGHFLLSVQPQPRGPCSVQHPSLFCCCTVSSPRQSCSL